MIHKKRRSVHVFESLARLAYNKGTALFRGNDPLQRSAAATFSLIINTPSQTHPTCSTRLTQETAAKPLMSSACPRTNTSTRRGLVLQKQILCFQPIHGQKITCSVSLTVTVECCFAIKLLN